eukprot:TRINITY_DN2140_c1_g1_i1.p1 TRINITY_DN2140_c1_g1~~TRINITY_DN2140_c1_g1_i1.p1  ORF type:complete len:355 (+),score=30.64 TRINITY_DN2140_c1_g1_i1:29-1066(+)
MAREPESFTFGGSSGSRSSGGTLHGATELDRVEDSAPLEYPASPGAEGLPIAQNLWQEGGARSLVQRYPVENAILAMFGGRRPVSELEKLLRTFWTPAAIFGGAEIVSFVWLRKSFFVAITNGAFEVGLRYASVVEVHVWASVAMWCMGAVQVFGENLRKSAATAWIHRLTGRLFLLLFFIIVFPTSLYLTAFQRIDYLAPAVGAVLLDTGFCTAYFLYRGWRVARLRLSQKSLTLHGRLMQCGIVMSMSILPQRLLQLYLSIQLQNHPQVNYSASILVTSILFVLFGHFKEGPRGGIWMTCIGLENAEEAFGSARPSMVEVWFWKLRWLMYMALYCSVRKLITS